MAKIKICGLFRSCDIDFVNEAEPDYIGFVFAKSPRQVSSSQAMNLRSQLKSGIVPVGVFVNAPPMLIQQLYRQHIIEIAQLHGMEDEAYMQKLKNLCDIPIIKAISVKKTEDIYPWQNSSADYLLLDNVGGGTGKAFDWRLIPPCKKPFFLAGGIGISNIETALSLSPYCVDVSSGAETDGKKDNEKILKLVQKARGGAFHGFYSKTECKKR